MDAGFWREYQAIVDKQKVSPQAVEWYVRWAKACEKALPDGRYVSAHGRRCRHMRYLEYLATEREVAASTQRQADALTRSWQDVHHREKSILPVTMNRC